MSGERQKKGLWLDPRAKLFLILICVLASMFAPSLAYQFALVVLIAILGTFFGKWKYVIKAVCFYAVICVLTVWIMAEMTGTLRTMFIAFLGLFHKVYACGMLAGIVLSTTKVNEFLSAMNRVHAPKKLVIPLAVMLRYIPTIQEDWRYIKDAMRMRDVSPSLGSFLSHPGMAFTREQLFTQVWNMEYMDDSRTLDMHIRTLRQKLGDSGRLIATIRNVGYRMDEHPEAGES